MATGLLDFLQTPAGMGLLTGAASYAAGAGRGAPVNAIGRGLLGGLAGYGNAQDRQNELAQQAKRNELFDLQLGQTRDSITREQQMRDAAKRATTPAMPAMGALNGSLPPELQTPVMPGRAGGFNTQQFLGDVMGIDPLKGMEWQAKFKPESQFAKVDPKDYTPASVQRFATTLNHADLVPVRKLDVVNNQAVDLYQAKPGQTFDQMDPNKPFGMVGGQMVPNTAYQEFALKDSAARAPKMPAINLADPTAVARAGMDLQDKVRGAFKEHHTIADQYRAMQNAVKDPSPQGDTALLYSFFKVLDPASTVREGEIDMVKASRSIPDKLKGYAQRLAGGGSLLQSEREDLLNQAQRQIAPRLTRASQDLQAYRENASRLGLDPSLYAPDPYDGIRQTSPRKDGKSPGESASSATKLPPNPNAQNLQKGVTYQTPLGEAEWDGMKFVRKGS